MQVFDFEVGDAVVEGAVVVPGRLEPFFEVPLVGSELADFCAEGGVLGEGALDGVLGQVEFQVTDASEQGADLRPLVGDLVEGVLEALLCVESSLLPGGLSACCAIGLSSCPGSTGVADCLGDELASLGVLIQEGPGDLSFSELLI